MGQWHPGQVALDDFGPLNAQIHVARRDGFARPRFARPEAEKAVAHFHSRHLLHASQSRPAGVEDMFWDPESPDTIVVTAPGQEPVRIAPDPDGMWAIDAPWCLVRQPWPDRDRRIAELGNDDVYCALARYVRLAAETARVADRQDDHAAWAAATAAEQEADDYLSTVLLTGGVPVAYVEEVATALCDAAAVTLPHSGIVAPRPCPQVVGIDYLETSRGVAFVAEVVRDRKPYGVIENQGDGGATTFTPTGTQEYGARLREMEAFAAACRRPGEDLCDEDVYNGLVDEYERAVQAARFLPNGKRTLIRFAVAFDYDYVVISWPTSAMACTLHTRLSPELRKLIEAGGRCEYWDGRCRWHRVTFIEQR